MLVMTKAILALMIGFIISVIILIVFVRVLLHKSDFIKFFATGLDSGFKVSEIFFSIILPCTLKEYCLLQKSMPFAVNR